ncbi:MAG: ERAP1-like C-terminal domain-containing protein [Gammaproteobacteria bacterium]|nr:ERAP1-like C-terminal domain-containing protein [Gammaproteobacteria bacterium]
MRNLFSSWVLLCLFVVSGCTPTTPQRADVTAVESEPTANKSETTLAPTGKLAEGVRPTAYQLALTLDPREDNFFGTVAITIELDQSANHIWLHGNNLDVASVTARTAGGEITGHYSQVLDSGVARVDFNEVLPAGTLVLEMEYSGLFDRNLAGLFKVEEQGKAYVLAKSESIQARRYLPSFDQPGFKANFDISLTIPAGYQAIGNGTENSRIEVGNGLEKVTFATTRPMPTYLLSLAVGPFDVVSSGAIPPNQYRSYPIPLRGFARNGRGKDLSYILGVTPRLVEIFEQQLQRPYPFKKLDIIAAPQWPSGATELSAAITYREQRILVEGDEPAPGARLALLGVHAHELAHMWFGNLVTPPWWDDLWLKEGFATWGTPLALTNFEPQGNHDLNAVVRSISAMRLDSLASTRAIREPITDNNTIRNAYDAITYAKSLGVIQMVDQYFGAEQFRPAVGRYVKAFADGVADSADFYTVIGKQTGTPELTESFRSFVEQKGVPLLNVELQCAKDKNPTVTITQQRYKPLGSPIVDSPQWSIPMCLRRADNSKQCLILSAPKQTVVLEQQSCPAWVHPNAGGSGYYRWNLPDAQWQRLIEHFAALTDSEALTVIDSGFAAFAAGQLSGERLLEIVSASAQADSRQVVAAPLAYLSQYSRQYLSPQNKRSWQAYLKSLYQPKLQQLANNRNSEQQLLRSQLLGFMALTGEDAKARAELAEKARAFTGFERKRDSEALDSDLYEAALTVALQELKTPFLQHLLKIRSELDDPLFENASVNAIGRIDDSNQLDKIHQLALSDQLGSREAFGLIQRALAQSPLSEQHWRWLQENFAQVAAKIPQQWRRNTPRFAAAFCDREKLNQVQGLFEAQQQLVPGYKRALAQTQEQITLCMALREKGQRLLAMAPKP